MSLDQNDKNCEEIKHIFISQITLSPSQPRKEFKPEELNELAQSISSVGFIHPPTVRQLLDCSTYELISGERRFRAAQLLGLKTIPVLIKRASNHVSAQAALIENIQRVDLNPLEIAKALKELMQEQSLSQDALALQIGKKRSTVANYLRLLSLPSSLQDSIIKGLITMGHAKAILSLNEENKQFLLHEIILRDDLNVREAEAAAQKINEKSKKRPFSYITRDFHLEQIEQKIQEKLGTKVFIQAKGKKGCVSIDYYSYQDLERLLILLGVQSENDL